MTKDLEKEAKAFQAQRMEIAKFIEGTSGNDFSQFITTVSGAVKDVRKVVAKAFSENDYTISPDNKSIKDILNDTEAYYSQNYADNGRYISQHSKGYYKSQKERLNPIIEAVGRSYFKPEISLDKAPDLLKKLAEDKSAFNNSELPLLKSLVSTLDASKKILTAAVEMHNKDPHGPINHAVAQSAHAALQVLDRNLLPPLATVGDKPGLHDKMLAFEGGYAQRHGNAVYVKMIHDLEGKKPRKPRRIGGYAATFLAGALAVEAGHQVLDTPAAPDASHTTTYDPQAEKASYLKALQDKGVTKEEVRQR